MPKFATVAIDSGSELSRLYFTKSLGKHSSATESLRGMNNYPNTTERLNMLIRRLKNLCKQGTEVVFLAHEDIQKIYARGGAMASKGETPQEPVAVKGWPDFPGNRTPDEMCRAADNVFRMRRSGQQTIWVAKREPLGLGGDFWEVKDRFNAQSINEGILPASYSALAAKVPKLYWRPPYVWMIYGSFGIGKTRSLLTFPRPLKLFDLDLGTKSIMVDVEQIREKEGPGAFEISSYDVEDVDSYEPFIGEIGKLF